MVSGVFMSLVGSPKANRFWVTGHTKGSSKWAVLWKDAKDSDVAKQGAAGASPWNQAQG